MLNERKLQVLVVEDNRDFAQLISDILEIQGCCTEVAYSGLSAFDKVKETPPDLIFSDINLPGDVNGLAFARMLRSDPKLAHIPLIAVSGYTTEEDKRRATDAGFDLVFPKPVKFADLGVAITRFSSGRN